MKSSVKPLNGTLEGSHVAFLGVFVIVIQGNICASVVIETTTTSTRGTSVVTIAVTSVTSAISTVASAISTVASAISTITSASSVVIFLPLCSDINVDESTIELTSTLAKCLSNRLGIIELNVSETTRLN